MITIPAIILFQSRHIQGKVCQVRQENYELPKQLNIQCQDEQLMKIYKIEIHY